MAENLEKVVVCIVFLEGLPTYACAFYSALATVISLTSGRRRPVIVSSCPILRQNFRSSAEIERGGFAANRL